MKKKVMKPRKRLQTPKKCAFCEEKKTPWFSDVEMLQRYLTERGKIMGRARNGLCASHQKELTSAVKYARYLALIPFISRD